MAARISESSLTQLAAFARDLKRASYEFVTVTPETHRRVMARWNQAGNTEGSTLRDIFGWSRPFRKTALTSGQFERARDAAIIESCGDVFRSLVRFSTLEGDLFVHSAYPTDAADAVFFGPDTYRFCSFVKRELEQSPFRRGVDIGCGSGAGAIVASRYGEEMLMTDINASALDFARVNALVAGVGEKTVARESDLLAQVVEPIDLIIANPPYMFDPARRAYRDGGGEFGEALAVRILKESLARLEPGGRLILYTGAAVVDGADVFWGTVRAACSDVEADWHYREIDPDVFGEEITNNPAYSRVERIAAVGLVVTVRSRP